MRSHVEVRFEVTRPCSGHTIVQGLVWDDEFSEEIYEKYGGGTPAWRVLDRLAIWLQAVEGGVRGSEELWEQLQLLPDIECSHRYSEE